jgi:hypothetical protein
MPLKVAYEDADLVVIDKPAGLVVHPGAGQAYGTMDFTDTGTSGRYSCQSPQGMGHQPPRQGGTLPTRRYCGLQSVFIKKDGMFATKDEPERTCPHNEPENITLPRECTLKDVWDLAKKRKVKEKGTATIELYDAFDGPAYRFKKGRQNFVVSARNCEKILKGRSARGSVP